MTEANQEMTHLEQISFLPALPAQIPETAVLLLHQLPGRAKLNYLAVIQYENPKKNGLISCRSCDPICEPAKQRGRGRRSWQPQSDERYW